MKLKNIRVKNFRNFDDVTLAINNKNVIFGMNDIGKTNLLHAIRFIFDRQLRISGFRPSDYHKTNTNLPIEIIIEIDLGDRNDETSQSHDTKLLISKIKEARNNLDYPDSFFIKLKGKFDEKEIFGNPILYWGSTLNDLELVPVRGQTSALDDIFHVEYINPITSLEYTFKKYKKNLFNNSFKTEEDIIIENKIGQNIDELNNNISKLDVVKEAQENLTSSYKTFRKEPLNIELRSEIAINGYLNNLIPYIKWANEDGYYPTGGDGRKKLLTYALTKMITEKFANNKIVIYLIEEPENNLHRSMQIAFSQQLFNEKIYSYFFLTTHSSEVLYEMDDTQLIRISNPNKSIGNSFHHYLPERYKNIKKMLNKGLSQAIFYNTVLLVEGGSEYTLFEAVLNLIYPTKEIDGKFILQVDGVGFKNYTKLFEALNIVYFVQTDNDIQRIKNSQNEYMLTGFKRCFEIIDEISPLQKVTLDINSEDKTIKLKEIKQEIFNKYSSYLSQLNESNIYLSEIDLENDLYKVMGQEMCELLKTDNPVSKLQERKLFNMVEFVKHLNKCQAKKIYKGFSVLKGFIDYEI